MAISRLPAASLLAFLLFSLAPTLSRASAARWVASWEAPPAPASTVGWDGKPTPPADYRNQTVREIARLSVGGDMIRVRLSNRYGKSDLTIAASSVALRAGGSAIVAETYDTLNFGGKQSVTIPAGADAVSDPMRLSVPAQAELAISLYLVGPSPAETIHLQQRSAVYTADGNQFSLVSFPPSDKSADGRPWVWLDEVDVATAKDAPVTVCFGDSITDGAQLTRDAAREWPTILAERLQQAKQPGAVINAGMSGNRLFHDGRGPGAFFGVNGLARFDSDVLAVPGVHSVIVLLGINDIGQYTPGGYAGEQVDADQITWGLFQLAARAHARGLKIYVGTLTPMADTTIAGYYSLEKDAVREAVNRWILRSAPGVFDGAVDFDRLLGDPRRPDHLLPVYDSGDHLHPSDVGAQAMAGAIPLDWCK